MIGLIGKKIGMTQIFKEDGERVPVTVISAGPCTVVQKKTQETDGYYAIQLGYEDIKLSKVNKPLLGHFKKSNIAPKKMLKEFRLTKEEAEKFNIGDEVKVNIFEIGSYVDVTAKSKGRGFAGVIKRHNFSRPTMSHGTHEYFRHGGSIGGRFPQRVVKGRKMPGHYGSETVTVQNLEIVDIIEEQNLILVKGAVPGSKNGYVNIRKALKKQSKK